METQRTGGPGPETPATLELEKGKGPTVIQVMESPERVNLPKNDQIMKVITINVHLRLTTRPIETLVTLFFSFQR